MTYKADVNDLRESVSLSVLEVLRNSGYHIDFHDPYISELKIHGTAYKHVELTKERLSAYDCVLILTDHSEIDYQMIIEHAQLIFDTRNRIKEKCDHVVRL